MRDSMCDCKIEGRAVGTGLSAGDDLFEEGYSRIVIFDLRKEAQPKKWSEQILIGQP